MPNLFKPYPKIDYKFADGATMNLTDLMVKFVLSDFIRQESSAFYPFNWRDGDRPDTIANKYYNLSDYYWLVLMSNDVFDVFHDMCVPHNIFHNYLVEKYKADAIANGYTENLEDVLMYCSSTPHHYEDVDGYIIDYQSHIELPNTKEVSIYEYEFNENENKRQIRLIDTSLKSRVQNELEDKLRQVRKYGDAV